MIKLRDFEDFSKWMSSWFETWPIPPAESMGKRLPENNWQLPVLDLRHQNTSAMDLSGYDMQDVTFDDKTKWPTDPKKCPKGYAEMDKITEYGKDPGLGIRKLHQQGIDGTGISIAIIDQLLGDHIEYHDNLVHYEEIGYDGREGKEADMHGSAVASIAVGKNCGVAPKAKLYYFAAENMCQDGSHKQTAINRVKALERIMEINETLPDKEKIQVVSMSWGAQGDPKTLYSGVWLKTLEKAKRKGLFVLTCASETEYNIFYPKMGRKVLKDPNQTSSYIESTYQKPTQLRSVWLQANKEQWKKNKELWEKNGGEKGFEKVLRQELQKEAEALEERKRRSCCVPAGHRTIASPSGKNDYVHYVKSDASWATPWLAGMFVLARQVNSDITPEHFWDVALKTGVFSEKVGGTVIQPQKLIESVQKEKGASTLKKTLKNGYGKTIQDLTKGKQNGK